MSGGMQQADPELLVSRQGSLGRIILNRPKVLNSLSLAMVRAIETALDAFAADPEIRAVWMTGGGRPGFLRGRRHSRAL